MQRLLSPLFVKCDSCQAHAHSKCTQPTDIGRVNVNWFHLSRESVARSIDQAVCEPEHEWHAPSHTCGRAD